MSATFDIRLKSILVKENGWIEKPNRGFNVVAATLHYPRAGTVSLTSMRDVTLEDDVQLDYPATVADEPQKAILFKETIEGDVPLSVEITAREKKSAFVKFLKKVLGDTVGDFLKAVPGLGSVVTAVATSVAGSILAGVGKKSIVIGKGVMPLNDATPEGDFVVQLSVPEEIEIVQTDFNEDGDRVQRKRTLKKGFVNAMVVFDLRRL